MPDLKNLDSLLFFLNYLLPGLISLHVRSQFADTKPVGHTDKIISYFAITIIYYGLISTFKNINEISSASTPFQWLTIFVVFPAILGLLLGVLAQKNFFWNLARILRMHPRHNTKTAWDWCLAQPPNVFVIVTLKNDEKFYGLYSSRSFASSCSENRDLFLERTYDFIDGQWIDTGETSVLISSGEVRTIEFIPPRKEVNA